eukprot:GDKK01012414.1.p1 GENE.GDKK01012414.1~~GDKK01012414.1.p1  ORF type:complete len:219 (+),score=54.28 GDKK01012414.1:1-657(+)
MGLYKQYQVAGGKDLKRSIPSAALSVKSPSSKDAAARSKDLFFPPLPGQTGADYHPQLRNPSPNDTVINFYSWHVHVYFFHEDVNVTSRTLALRDQFISTFSLAQCSDDCFMGGPFDTCNQGMCVWEPVYGVDGPHPYGQWGVYMPNEYVAETVSWFSANHGEFEVLFHPNTGYMVGDHDSRAIWIKQMVPLDINFLIWLQCEWFECSLQNTVPALPK